MKAQDERAKREDQLRSINKRLSEATFEHLQTQKTQQTGRQDTDPRLTPTTSKITDGMSKIAEISKEKRDLEKALMASSKSSSQVPKSSTESVRLGKRLRKLSWKLRGG